VEHNRRITKGWVAQARELSLVATLRVVGSVPDAPPGVV